MSHVPNDRIHHSSGDALLVGYIGESPWMWAVYVAPDGEVGVSTPNRTTYWLDPAIARELASHIKEAL